MPDVKIKVDIEIIHPKEIDGCLNKNSYQFYKSCLTKKEIVKLITDEIKLEETEMINFVEILNQASLSNIEQTEDSARLQNSSELFCGEGTNNETSEEEKFNKRVDEVRAELRKIYIELGSKGFAECKQILWTSLAIKKVMKDTKPIKHRIRPVTYHCREEFHQIVKDQLAAGIIRPSTSAMWSPVNLVLKEYGSLRLTIDNRKVNNATEADPYPLPRIDDIISQLAKNKIFSKIGFIQTLYYLSKNNYVALKKLLLKI